MHAYLQFPSQYPGDDCLGLERSLAATVPVKDTEKRRACAGGTVKWALVQNDVFGGLPAPEMVYAELLMDG